jgi:hypothetical protein
MLAFAKASCSQQPAPYFANPSRHGVIAADDASLKIPRLVAFEIFNAVLHVAYQPSVAVKQINFHNQIRESVGARIFNRANRIPQKRLFFNCHTGGDQPLCWPLRLGEGLRRVLH